MAGPASSSSPLLVIANADAIVRTWRSAWAWMPVDRGRGIFRLAWVATAWVATAVILYALLLGVAGLVLAA